MSTTSTLQVKVEVLLSEVEVLLSEVEVLLSVSKQQLEVFYSIIYCL